MSHTIFYSWQSDTPSKEGRNLIEHALESAITRISKDETLTDFQRDLRLDQDTRGVAGSPPITATILKKIQEAILFVPDLTACAINSDAELFPNPNVLIEYGWSLHSRTATQIIGVMNEAHGKPAPATLPFHLRPFRFPITYNLPTNAADPLRRQIREQLARELEGAIRDFITSEEFLARMPKPPAPSAFPQKSPMEGKARFRPSKDPLGIGEDIEATLLQKPEPEVYLSNGPAIWMRVMPAYGPAKKFPNHYLQSRIVELCILPLMPNANPRRVTGEDGCGFCQVIDNSSKALAVAYVFNTGEIWVINAYLPHNYVELDESRFTKTLDECVSFLDKLGVAGPYNWEVGFEGIKGRRLVALNREFRNQCVSPNIELRGTYNKGDNAAELLLPFFEDVFDKFRSKRPTP